MKREAETEPRRLLVRGVNWLGDAVMTTPALMRLREKFPKTHIAILTPEKLADLWQPHPAIDEVIPFATGEGIFSVARKLRAGQFDVALVLPNSPRSALEVYLAGIPRCLGYARPWRNFFLTQTIAPRADAVKKRKRSVTEIQALISRTPEPRTRTPAAAHQLHEYLHLVAALGANPEPMPPQLQVTPTERVALDWALPPTGKLTDHIIGLNPGAEYGPAKRWPVENFAAVANELYRRRSCEFLIFGGKGDVPVADMLIELLPIPKSKGHVTSLAGKTNLRDLMAGFSLCRVVLTNDTGPMHVAAALGIPVVAPFGSTSRELTGPGLPGDPRHRLLRSDARCSPCFLRECPIDFRCMKGITVEQVVAAMLELLGKS
jgi:heptosyltransferase-2